MNGAELPAGALTWDAAARVMRVRLTGLARDRYTFRVNARSRSGRSAEELIVPMWVEETPYQWGDGTLYFVFTDPRFDYRLLLVGALGLVYLAMVNTWLAARAAA
jgi:hypothetical protein